MSDMEQILQWNKDLPCPKSACVHELIELRAQTQPEAPAVHAWDGELTYARLEELATALAHRLVALGAGPEQFVPLCFEKSMWAVVSMLAVLKAGSACAFLEPTHPMERLRSMLSDMNAHMLLCSPFVASRFVADKADAFKVVPITKAFTEGAAFPSVLSRPLLKPSNAAICLFTSGSTGKPKGIIQEHSTAAFSAQTCARVFGIGPGSRVLQWAAYCFDMSVIDMLMSLVGGGCICIPSEKDRTDNLLQTMRDMGINFAAMTPSFAQTLKSEGISSLETIVFGGEPVARDHLAGWPNNLRIINAYGPAEGSVCVAGNASQECPAKVGSAVGAVTWIANENDCEQLASIGSIGELLMEGPLLARGYLNDPEKTASSFIEDVPWLVRARQNSDRPRRLYKTGDLARYHKDGMIVLMGRKDTQVKLRGQRIETAEIEHHIISRLPRWFTIVVDVINPAESPGTQKLVAFLGIDHQDGLLVDCDDQALLVFTEEQKDSLRSILQDVEADLPKSLPPYMIPSYFIPMRYIPLTTAGKTDRKRLGRIGSSLTVSQILQLTRIDGRDREQQDGLRSRNMEQELAELWGEILKLDAGIISPRDDFFKLGGDSITAMQLVAAASVSQIRLTTTEVFQNSSLVAMSIIAAPNSASAKTVQSTQVAMINKPEQEFLKSIFCPGHSLVASEVEEVVEAVDMQAYMAVCGLLKTHGYINYFAFDLKGPVDPESLQYACKVLITRHSALRTIFGIRAGRVLQIILKSYEPEFLQLSSQSTTETLLSKLCEIEKSAEARLGDKVVRLMLIERNSSDYTLIMRISHALFDGTTLALIYRDLQMAYKGDILLHSPQYTDFSRAVLEANTRESEEFWRTTLRGSTMTSVVQNWRPSFKDVINDKVSLNFPFGDFYSPGITVATLVKGAWAAVLAEMSMQKDVVFGYAVTGRNLPLRGINRIVGDCNNAALARVRLDLASTVLELLRQVQAQYLAAIAYESMGPRQMIEKCTDWPRWTRYSTSVNHQNYADAGLESFRVGEADCKVSYKDLEVDRRDVQIYSWPQRHGEMKIEMAFCNRAIPCNIAQKMLEALGTKIQSFAADMDVPLILSSAPCYTIPLRLPESNKSADVCVHPKARSFRFSLVDPDSLVERVWGKFLACIEDELLIGVEVTADMPFYELAGDLVYATQLSAWYEEEGVDFAMESLIERPSKRGQLDLLRSI